VLITTRGRLEEVIPGTCEKIAWVKKKRNAKRIKDLVFMG